MRQLSFAVVKLLAFIKKPTILSRLYTIKATGFPFVALYHCKIRAISGKCPAIMKGPVYFDMVFTQIAKQHFQVAIVSVKVVEVDNIGRNAI